MRPLAVSVFVGVLVFVGVGCGASGPKARAIASAASTNVAERAFTQWLALHHPGFHGPSLCPSRRLSDAMGGRVPCVAELHRGTRYIQVWGLPSRGPTIAIKLLGEGTWIRRWSTYARPPQHVSPGLISVNAAGGYDWRWLLLGVDYECRQKHRDSCSAGALDGQWNGYPLFYSFSCHVRGELIACRNKLGDAVRWRPHAH